MQVKLIKKEFPRLIQFQPLVQQILIHPQNLSYSPTKQLEAKILDQKKRQNDIIGRIKALTDSVTKLQHKKSYENDNFEEIKQKSINILTEISGIITSDKVERLGQLIKELTDVYRKYEDEPSKEKQKRDMLDKLVIYHTSQLRKNANQSTEKKQPSYLSEKNQFDPQKMIYQEVDGKESMVKTLGFKNAEKQQEIEHPVIPVQFIEGTPRKQLYRKINQIYSKSLDKNKVLVTNRTTEKKYAQEQNEISISNDRIINTNQSSENNNTNESFYHINNESESCTNCSFWKNYQRSKSSFLKKSFKERTELDIKNRQDILQNYKYFLKNQEESLKNQDTDLKQIIISSELYRYDIQESLENVETQIEDNERKRESRKRNRSQQSLNQSKSSNQYKGTSRDQTIIEDHYKQDQSISQEKYIKIGNIEQILKQKKQIVHEIPQAKTNQQNKITQPETKFYNKMKNQIKQILSNERSDNFIKPKKNNKSTQVLKNEQSTHYSGQKSQKITKPNFLQLQENLNNVKYSNRKM